MKQEKRLAIIKASKEQISRAKPTQPQLGSIQERKKERKDERK